MITILYIICFVLFFISLLWFWYSFLKNRKLSKGIAAAVIVLGVGFVLFAAVDNAKMKERSLVASEMADADFDENREEDGGSEWNRKLYRAEQEKMESYQWDKDHLNLEESPNRNTAADMLQNVYMAYLNNRISLEDSSGEEFEKFQSNRGGYLGKYVDLYGICYQMTDAKELPFSEVFSSQNPSCELRAFYYQYEGREERFLVWEPSTIWTPASLEEAEYMDGAYIGQIELEQVWYDVYVKNF